MSATKRVSKRIQNPINIKKGQGRGSKRLAKVQHITSKSQSLQKRNQKSSSIICLDDESIEKIQPQKKIKQDVGQAEHQDEVILTKKASSIKTPIVSEADRPKIARLNHFFKQDGQILFEVMVGTTPAKLCRWPQLVTYSQLVANQQTKFMVYQFIASACKSIALEEELQQDCQNSQK